MNGKMCPQLGSEIQSIFVVFPEAGFKKVI